MLTLILLRHAKSSWATPGMNDFDRTLNDRGRNDAPLMAKWISAQGLKPDRILCSPAVRTRETLALIAPVLAPLPESSLPKPGFPEDFYLASATTMRNRLARERAGKTVLVVGHNPGLHDTVLQLLTPDERQTSGDLRATFPTAACAVLALPIEAWSDIKWDIARLASYMVPKALSSADMVAHQDPTQP